LDGGVHKRKVRKIGSFDGWIGLNNGDEAGRWFVVGKLSYM
jgi:hypothetical protein